MTGDALDLDPDVDDRDARCQRLAYLHGRVLDRERNERARRDARLQLIPDEPGQLQDGAAFGRGPEVAFRGDPLAVEREDIAHGRDRVEERDREVVGIARRETRQRRVIPV